MHSSLAGKLLGPKALGLGLNGMTLLEANTMVGIRDIGTFLV